MASKKPSGSTIKRTFVRSCTTANCFRISMSPSKSTGEREEHPKKSEIFLVSEFGETNFSLRQRSTKRTFVTNFKVRGGSRNVGLN